MLKTYIKRVLQSLAFLFAVSQFVLLPANAATVVVTQKTPLAIIGSFEKNLKSHASMSTTGTLTTKLLPENVSSSYDLRTSAITSKKIIATFKALRLATVRPAKYNKEEVVDGVRVFRLSGKLTAAGTYAAVQSFLPFVTTADLTPREYNSLKSSAKYISNGEAQMVFEATTFTPTKVVITWTTTDPKFKNKVLNSVTVYFSFPTGHPLVTASSSGDTVNAPVATTISKTDASNTVIMDTRSAGNSSSDVTLSHVVSASVRSVDINGGGVIPASSGDIVSAAGRDTQRINDLKAIQIALESYYTDQGFYPPGGGLMLGQSTATCLNSDGFTSSDNCAYPYMAQVPADPKNNAYVYTGGGASYTIAAKLESGASGLKGSIKVTQSGFSQQ